MSARKSSKPRLPRAPLPRQRGGAHEDRSKRPFRREKHKKDPQRRRDDQ
jgi:hypothetical protein